MKNIILNRPHHLSKMWIGIEMNINSISINFLSLQISDINRANDLLLGDSPVQVALTPPPNLEIDKIVLPSPSLSGEELSNSSWVNY